jgi:cytochrome c oxidase assembly protein subunit 15
MFVTNQGKKPVILWLYSGMFLVFLMVVVGAITRLTESGLSIVDWNVVMGSLPPMTESDWLSEFEKYKTSPEFLQKNFYFTLEDFKSIYWWEWGHRFLGRLIGLVFIIPCIIFWRKGFFKKEFLPRLLFIFFLGGFQGFLGWYMVKSGLTAEPRVSHYRLAMHLSNALLTFGVIWWTVLDIRYPAVKHLRDKFPKIKQIWFITFILLVLQIVYGAFVAGKDAGQLFNTWPLMEGYIVHPAVTATSFFDTLLNNLAGIQFVHRTLAIVLYFSIFWLWLHSRKVNLRHDQRLGANLMFIIVNVQFLLGVLTLLNAVPIWLGVLHQAGAVALLTASLYFIYQLKGTA